LAAWVGPTLTPGAAITLALVVVAVSAACALVTPAWAPRARLAVPVTAG
jgi:hypothetical protein